MEETETDRAGQWVPLSSYNKLRKQLAATEEEPEPIATAETLEQLAEGGHEKFKKYVNENGLGATEWNGLDPRSRDGLVRFVEHILRAAQPYVDTDCITVSEMFKTFQDAAGPANETTEGWEAVREKCSDRIRYRVKDAPQEGTTRPEGGE